MPTPRDPRLDLERARRILEAIRDAWVPVGASVEHFTNRVTLEALHPDWVAFNMAIDEAEVFLRETKKPSGEYPEVKPPPKSTPSTPTQR
jgi:hypothetical protein